MIASMFLVTLMRGVGIRCLTSASTTGAFIGTSRLPAHVVRIDRVALADPSYQNYAVAFVNYATNGVKYLTFPAYRRLAPDMDSLLGYLLGHRFMPADANTVVPVTAAIHARLYGPNFSVARCAEWAEPSSGSRSR